GRAGSVAGFLLTEHVGLEAADPAGIAAAHAEFAADGKARLIVNVTVQDGEGKDVMRAVAHWYLRARPQAK
ncbi:hypothetical protein IHN58_20255, partial [Deinococcus sp. 12RED42]|nr:hypothetical protein [Deinococcus sp. 12RED42]